MGQFVGILWASCGPFRGLWDLVLWDASGDDDLGDLLDLAPADRAGFTLWGKRGFG